MRLLSLIQQSNAAETESKRAVNDAIERERLLAKQIEALKATVIYVHTNSYDNE
jgi:hypothetical protein